MLNEPYDEKKIRDNPFSQLLMEKEKLITALKFENEMLRNIIALIPGHVYWKSKEGKFLGCNNNVAEVLGFSSPKEIIGKNNSDLLGTELATLIEQIDTEVKIHREEKYIEETGLNILRQPAIYLTKKFPLLDESGNIIGVLGVSFDITERKKMEEDLKIAKENAEASSRSKTQFLAVINHELRTPLTSIIGLVDFLKQGNLSLNEEKNIISAIDNCTQYLLSLVNEILEFSRLETGEYHLRIDEVNLNTILDDVYSITKTLAKKKGLELRIECGPHVPKNIITDPRALRQILINLVSNAIKFTDQGHVAIQINNLRSTKQTTQLELKVIDTGLGIPSDKLNLIFEPFQQLEDAYTRQSSRAGTGLGLTIVEKLAALINATIQVTSEPGKGSVFTLVGNFDIEPFEEPNILIIENRYKEKNKRNTTCVTKKSIYPHFISYKPSILLVEDDPIVQYLHKKMLAELGCEVDAVFHGHEAIHILNKHHIVFVDISLPDINGFEVIKKIRMLPHAHDIPIVALTVYTGKEEKIACLKAGANEFTSKPVSKTLFKKILLRYLT